MDGKRYACLGACAMVGLGWTPARAQPVVIADSDFTPGSWDLVVFSGWGRAGQIPNGLSGTGGLLEVGVSGCSFFCGPESAWLYSGWYDPGAWGGIACIDFSVASRRSWLHQGGIIAGLAVEQGGELRRTAIGFTAYHSDWELSSIARLTSYDLPEVDFSAGAPPIRFGLTALALLSKPSGAGMELDDFRVTVHPESSPPCWADLSSSAILGSAGFGVPDGVVSTEDFFYYLYHYAEGIGMVCDMTTTATPGTPGYGVPDGLMNSEDFFYYLAIYAGGC